MKRSRSNKAAAIFAVLCLLIAGMGMADRSVPNDISAFSYGELSVPSFASLGEADEHAGEATVTLFGLPFKKVKVNLYENVKLIPGGEAFGVKLRTRGVTVVGTGTCGRAGEEREPAKEAGIGVNDVILCIDGKEIASSDELTRLIAGSGGKPMRVTYERAGKQYETELKAACDENGVYKAGMWVRDTVAGIGTVTFTEVEGGFTGGLGHGICDNETGKLLPFNSGEIYDAHITGVKRGKPGEPGELRGYFGKDAIGEVISNTEAGVFGVIDKEDVKREPVSIALKDEVKEGPAVIYCTVNGEGVKEYTAEISRIISYESETKNFIIRITDTRLLSETGGIVQGMSGSPVLQNGKLVGAVTHVLVNDPAKGYGIFIENMLDEAVRSK